MSKKRKTGILRLILFCLFLLTSPITAHAAILGQVLSSPEAGWRRYDNLNAYFHYQGTWSSINNGSKAYYAGEMTQTNLDSNGDAVKFKFKGSKLRIIQQIYITRSEKIQVIIDDNIVGTYSLYHPTLSTDQCLVYEIDNLTDGVHYVELSNLNIEKRFCFDAIDIDSAGELLPYDRDETSSNLKAIGGVSKVDLSWSAVTNATSYKIKRSTTAGGPYTTIAASVTGTTYTDTDVTNGTTYYYVVVAIVNGNESWNSNEASATPVAPEQPSGNRALLVITMVTGERKEYEMTMDKITDFIAWYNSKAASNPTYIIEKNYNKASFISRKDYIAYDQISNFEVNEYNEQ
jgi:hypothetical protein